MYYKLNNYLNNIKNSLSKKYKFIFFTFNIKFYRILKILESWSLIYKVIIIFFINIKYIIIFLKNIIINKIIFNKNNFFINKNIKNYFYNNFIIISNDFGFMSLYKSNVLNKGGKLIMFFNVHYNL